MSTNPTISQIIVGVYLLLISLCKGVPPIYHYINSTHIDGEAHKHISSGTDSFFIFTYNKLSGEWS